ncbi:MAG: 50S ribosomal protein L3 [Spirochaetia bacterium]|jgi:large subunit ribosomal protein L3|nr:50S ribosomal protein L3 [Spirochaetia bacterium]
MVAVIAEKIGMTQVFDEKGVLTPVTVIKVDENLVVEQRTTEKNGYNSVVLGYGEVKKNRILKPVLGQFGEDKEPRKYLKEMRDFELECKAGDKIGIEIFNNIASVDVIAVSKGKGFQGVMKRHNFGGGRSTHGSKFHREAGSTGQASSPSRTFKNVKMAGRMGSDRVTVQNLRVVKVDPENKTLLVAGSVPGVNKSILTVRKSIK